MQMWNLFSSFHVVCVPHKTAAVAHSMPEVSGECQHVSLHFLLTITNYTCQVNILFSFRSPNNKLSRGKSSSSCLSPPHLELSHSRWSDECGFRRWSEKKVDKSSEMLLMMSSQAFGTSSGFCTHKKKERISHFHFLLSSFFPSIILFRILQSIILIERALGQSENFLIFHLGRPPPLSGDDDVKWRKTIL